MDDSEDESVDLSIDSGSTSESDSGSDSPGPTRRWASVVDSESDSDVDDEDGGTSSGSGSDGSDESEDGSEEESGEDDDDDDDASDSSEDERANVNTAGAVPSAWYDQERHVGYDKGGKRVLKAAEAAGGGAGSAGDGAKLPMAGKGDSVQFFLDRQDGRIGANSSAVWDEYNQRTVHLTPEEMRAIKRIGKGMFPHLSVDPFPDLTPWATKDALAMPLTGHEEPKRRFLPSKWEAMKVVKLVRAMRNGWITPPSEEKRLREAEEREGPPLYMLWSEAPDEESAKAATGLSYVPASKPALPGHAHSYRPPPEFIDEEAAEGGVGGAGKEGEEGRAGGEGFDALRRVPAYPKMVNERFERCLDLYLCPRMRSRKGERTAENLQRRMAEEKRKTPKPSELKPFPRTLSIEYSTGGGEGEGRGEGKGGWEGKGHQGPVHALAPDAAGRVLASGGEDGAVRLWEVATGRLLGAWNVGAGAGSKEKENEKGKEKGKGKGKGEGVDAVRAVAWRPNAADGLLLCVAGTHAWVIPALSLPSRRGAPPAHRKAGEDAIKACFAALPNIHDNNNNKNNSDSNKGCVWGRAQVPHANGGGEGEGEGEGGGGVACVRLSLGWPATRCCWHPKGDYFATVCPTGNTKAVLVHQLSTGRTQTPFNRSKGKIVDAVSFHTPSLSLACALSLPLSGRPLSLRNKV